MSKIATLLLSLAIGATTALASVPAEATAVIACKDGANPSSCSFASGAQPGNSASVKGRSPASTARSGMLNFGAVPEPAVWGLMILGFGAVGAGLRRRKAGKRRPSAE